LFFVCLFQLADEIVTPLATAATIQLDAALVNPFYNPG
jgi:hypothetical protein